MYQWDELPTSCLQVVGQHLKPQDSLSLRLACNAWARCVPLPLITLNLTLNSSGPSCTAVQKLSALLQAVQHTGSAVRAAREVAIKLTPCSQPCSLQASSSPARQPTGGEQHSPQGQQQQQQQEQQQKQQPEAKGDACSTAGLCMLADVLQALQSTRSLCVYIHKPSNPNPLLQRLQAPRSFHHSCSAASGAAAAPMHSAATLGDCHAALLQLLALPQLQQQLRSLSLSCEGAWPCQQLLADALQQLQGLKALRLHNCPLSTLTKLPSLSQLQQLAVSGRVFEPAPRSYSVRQLPLLPLLPQLQQLRVHNLPHDVHSQEYEDIWYDLKRRSAAQHTTAATPNSTTISNSCSSKHGDVSTTTSSSRSGSSALKVADWRSQPQWVSRSIQQQCPNLQTLYSDMILGPCVRQLPHLVSCTTPQLGSSSAGSSTAAATAAAAAAAAGTVADSVVDAGPSAAKQTAQHKGTAGSCLAVSALATEGGSNAAAAVASASTAVQCAGARTPHNSTAAAAAVRQEASYCCRERGVLCKCCG